MYKVDILAMAYRNLMRRKVRTFLTVLGVLIGTMSIVTMLSIGIGFDKAMKDNMAQWGSLNMIEVYPGANYDEFGEPQGEALRLNDEAVDYFRTLDGAEGVSPVYRIDGQAIWGRKEGYLNLVGVLPEEMKNLEFESGEGRLLQQDDRFNIVVGAEVGMNFYDPRGGDDQWGHIDENGNWVPPPNTTPEMLDERILFTVHNMGGKQKRYNFTVVGILSDKSRDKSWQAYAPLSEIKNIRTFIRQGGGGMNDMYGMYGYMEMPVGGSSSKSDKDRQNDYDFIWIKAKDMAAARDISAQLKNEGYRSFSMVESLEGIEKTSSIIQGVLGGIGSITLLVAAIGIINTMIMSIYERTREIGVMKVIGASFSDIRFLFLTEAGLIGLLGGIGGLIISYGLSFVINKILVGMMNQGGGDVVSKLSIIPPWLLVFALVFSFMIGVVSGMYPANRAVRLSPVEAIRSE